MNNAKLITAAKYCLKSFVILNLIVILGGMGLVWFFDLDQVPNTTRLNWFVVLIELGIVAASLLMSEEEMQRRGYGN